MPSPPTGAVNPPPFTRTAMPRTMTPFVLLLSAVVAAAGPLPLAAQRTELDDWYHVARTDSETLRSTSYAATLAVEGAGAMTVMCGALDLPVVAFLHPPLAGSESKAGVRLLIEQDSVSVWREGEVHEDRQSTRVTHLMLDLIRYRARENDRVRVRIEAWDTADAVDVVFSAQGLREAARRLRCVDPIQSDSMTVRPRLVNNREVALELKRVYPRSLWNRGIGGTVNVWFFIDRTGRVTETLVNEGSRYKAFDDAALKVAKIMRFTPAYNGPQRVPVWVAFDITFEVQSRW